MSEISQKLKEFMDIVGIGEEGIATMTEMKQSTISMILNDRYYCEPVRINRFFSTGLPQQMLAISVELKAIPTENYGIVPDSIALKRMYLHHERSVLINQIIENKKMRQPSNSGASLVN